MSTIRQIKTPDGTSHNIYANFLPYGVCGTAAGTAAKTVTVDNFSLETGAIVAVKFTNANSASSPTLNVNSTGAKPIYRYGTTAASTSTTVSGWVAGAVQIFLYDGTGWIRDYWSNTTYTNAALGQGYGTCSTAAATVAKAVTLSSYSLTLGGIVAVKFTNAVPASATMNINSKGAKPIYYKGKAIVDGVICGGEVATFIYDGTNYHLLGIDRNRFFTSLVPYGTQINASSSATVDLNTAVYMKVGNYFCSSNAIAEYVSNIPKAKTAFMMQVYSPLSQTVDNESGTWVYRLRKIMYYTGEEYVQYNYTNGTGGNWQYGPWKKITVDSDLSSYVTDSDLSTYATKTYVDSAIGAAISASY